MLLKADLVTGCWEMSQVQLNVSHGEVNMVVIAAISFLHNTSTTVLFEVLTHVLSATQLLITALLSGTSPNSD